jgi:DNA mismatch endonuclease, patch repair protein
MGTSKTKREYLRDGRAPIPAKESTSKLMSSNKGKNTGPEELIRKALRAKGFTGYRLHWKNAPGRPDISFPGKRIAIFINGCFWHRCPICDLTLPRSNTSFWQQKFDANVKRDAIKLKKLKDAGWKTIVIWECQIKKNIEKQIAKIIKLIEASHI